ncbi:CPBP family intramembrane metalloprotease [Bacteroidia bacterium]|nr:CPBP family intramembrane metalloprotease [Bacteroidia bacterium]MDB9882046.1 CPBP family intramembrane metalloprotease [Bacteroidia bacterium]
MDELQDGKDTETIESRPSQIHALLHLVLGFLFFFGAASVLAGLGMVLFSFIQYGKFEGVSELISLVDDLKASPVLLKLFVFFTSSLPLIVAVLITMQFIKASPSIYLLWNRPKNMRWFWLSLVFVIAGIPLMGFLLELNNLIDFTRWPEFHTWLLTQENTNNEMYEAMIGPKTALSFLTSVLFMALLPAVAEELFFRGFLMNVFHGLFKNIHISVFVTALIFSLVHTQFMKAIPMMFLAVIFGYAVYWTSSIWTSILAHFLNNFLAVVQLYLFTDGDYNQAIEQGQQLPMVANVALVLVVLGLFYYIQKHSNTKTQNFYV